MKKEKSAQRAVNYAVMAMARTLVDPGSVVTNLVFELFVDMGKLTDFGHK